MNVAYLLVLISHLLGPPASAPPPSARLTVEAVDSDDAPIAGATVRLQALGDATAGGPSVGAEPTTDEQGRWTADTVEPGETEIVVEAIGYERSRRVVELTAGQARRERFELAAVPSAPVEVRIVDEQGAPVPGGRAGLAELSQRPGGTYESGISDERGVIAWPRVPLGRYELTVQLPDGFPGERPEPVRLEVAGGLVARQVVLRRLPGRPVEGAVAGPSGQALAGVEIVARGEGPGSGPFEATSEADGTFHFDHLPYGLYQVLVEAPGVAGIPARDLRVDREPAPWHLRVPEGVEVSGRLLVPPGVEANAPWTISAVRWGGGRAGGRLDGESSYRTDALAPGRWTLKARSGRLEGQADVKIEDGSASVHRNLAIGPPYEGSPVFGMLTHRGEPLAGATVVLWRPRPRFVQYDTRTDASGRFRIADVTDGNYTLSVGWQGKTVLLEVVSVDGPTDLTDRMGELDFAWVRGRVEIDGVDPSTLSIRCGYRGGGEPGGVVIITSDTYPGFIHPRRDGTFEVGPLRGGRWAFTVDAPGHAPLEREVTLAGQDVDDLVLAPEPTAGLALRLMSESGALPDHVSATYRSAEGGREIRDDFRPTDPIVEWPSVPVGRGTVELETDFVRIPPFPVEVPGPPVEIHLPPRGIIRLEAPLIGDDQLGAARLTVRSLDHADRTPKSLPLRDRARTLYDLQPGLYELTLETPDGTTWSEVVEVRDQQTARVRFD